MSDLRAPGERAERREDARHGRPAGRSATALPETPIRAQLLRLALIPAATVALGTLAALLALVLTTPAPGAAGWSLLVLAVLCALGGCAGAALAARRGAHRLQERIGALRRSTARGQSELRRLVEALGRGEAPPERRRPEAREPGGDSFDLLAGEVARAHEAAVAAVTQAARLPSRTGSEQKLEVFVSLARRLQSLVHREISLLDELENEVEDPDLLKGLFHVDHLATRIRRHAENLAVLGGAMSRRQWSHPVSMTEVLRSAVAEVEQYARVKLVPPVQGTVRGHAVADVIHLLAELVENATVFSAPKTEVLLRVNPVAAGLAVEVEDRGLGMPGDEQSRMNALLADPAQVNVASLLQDGRIGLYVVSQLARRHGIAVRLQANIYGGVQAVLVLPGSLVGTGGEASAAPEQTPAATSPGPALAQGTPVQGTPAHGTPLPGPARPAALSPRTPPVTGTPAHGTPAHGTPAPAQGTPVPVAHRGDGRDGREAETALPMGGSAPGIAKAGARIAGVRAGAVPPARAPRPEPGGESPAAPAERPPRLPRRRAQQSLAPQLREAPARRPEETGPQAVHDPGLMAAFRSGVSRAEAQRPPARTPGGPNGEAPLPADPGAARRGSAPTG
ncbi:membrane protein [Streptomyces albus]|uniref:histidine kinase n=1 Tax=Streptomyces albus (strain ATCC 21838 / DSM 41398 / FERM P-419 / JCM 4703 / NBRC 107858) TaxID=1081613 RepID=A0A0B5EWK1_STRA4|nr:membrane protein [Streptomyces albus]AOU81503.1 membrane protein [Streptomyces albus]AYN37195.1 ATP-binding protein [Streptomyces albus]